MSSVFESKRKKFCKTPAFPLKLCHIITQYDLVRVKLGTENKRGLLAHTYAKSFPGLQCVNVSNIHVNIVLCVCVCAD